MSSMQTVARRNFLLMLAVFVSVPASASMTVQYAPVTSAALTNIPTLSDWGMLMLILSVAFLAAKSMRQRSRQGFWMVMLLAASTAVQTEAISQVSWMEASMSNPQGASVTVSTPGFTRLTNTSGVRLSITGISPNNATNTNRDGVEPCTANLVLEEGASCYVDYFDVDVTGYSDAVSG